MSIKRKTIAITGLLVFILMITMVTVSTIYIRGGYLDLEEEAAREEMIGLHTAVQRETDIIEEAALNVAANYQISKSLQTGITYGLENTISRTMMSRNGFNFVTIITNDNEILYSRLFDPGSGETITNADGSFGQRLIEAGIFSDERSRADVISGLIRLDESPAYIAVCPVAELDGFNSLLGVVVCGQYLDSKQVKNLADYENLYNLTAFRIDSPALPEDFFLALSEIENGLPIPTMVLAEDRIAAYQLLTDINGDPAVILRTDQPRDIYHKGMNTIYSFFWIVIGFCLIFAVGFWILINKHILSRLIYIKETLDDIDSNREIAERLSLSGRDELVEVTHSINGLFLRINQSFELVRDSENTFRTIAEESPNMIFIIVDGNIVYANKICERTIGYTCEEFYTTCSGLKEHFAPEVRQRLEELYADLDRGVEAEELETVMLTRQGERRDVMHSVRPIRYKDRPGLFCMLTDITERKRTESHLLVTSKLASIGELASGVAHELNNPLTSVLGFAHILSQRDDLADDMRDDLQIICDQGERAARIVKNLLSFARQYKPGREMIDINKLIESTVALREYDLNLNNIKVANTFDTEIPYINVDQHQIQQVLMNMFINAEQAILAKKNSGLISISTWSDNGMVHVAIKDDGTGINPKHLNNIFDPFFTTKPVSVGTGLGLSICHGIISEHHGRIDVYSVPGKGSTFIISIPIGVDEEPEPVSNNEIEWATVDSRKRILVIDDEVSLCQYVKRSLSSAGFTVNIANTGQEALELLKTNDYDHCLVDIKMPGLRGDELYEIMTDLYPEAAEKVIFMTGDTFAPVTSEFLELSGRPFISKPFHAEDLLHVIRVSSARYGNPV